jgi:hypothetical protein
MFFDSPEIGVKIIKGVVPAVFSVILPVWVLGIALRLVLAGGWLVLGKVRCRRTRAEPHKADSLIRER